MKSDARIMLVDDELPVLHALQRFFRRHGYEVTTCQSGQEAIALLEKTAPYNLIISDYRMPGMNGVEFLGIIKNRWPETVRMVLSGFADSSTIIAATNEGNIYKFIPKPWDESFLIASVRQALDLNANNIRRAEQARILDKAIMHLSSLESDLLVNQSQVVASYHTLIDQMPVGVIGVDKTGEVVSMNELAREMLGLSVSPLGEPASEALQVFFESDGSVVMPESGYFIAKVNNREIKVLVKRLQDGDSEGVILIMVLLEGGAEHA